MKPEQVDRPFYDLITSSSFRIIVSAVIVFGLVCYAWLIGEFTPYLYLACISLVYVSAPPKYLFSPKNVLFAYHFIWYTFPLMFAMRYEDYHFNTFPEMYCFTMLITTYLIGMLTFHFSFRDKRTFVISSVKELNYIAPSVINLLLVVATLATVFLTMLLSSRGIVAWLSNPGLAFADREGSGPFTILLIFLYGVTLPLGGFYIFKYRNSKILIFAYIVLCMIIFMVILGRAKLLTFLLLLFLIPIYKVRMKIKSIILVVAFIAGSVYVTSLLRGTFSDTSGDVAKMALNYFDTYDALVKVVRDESPSFGSTFLMSFNKFLTPFGYEKDMPYTVSQKYTHIYYPGVGERTTVQFPIEADLYLSFGYWGGTILLFAFFYTINFFFIKAHRTRSLGAIFLAISLLIYMVSHLRGMLIEWTDLYYYPMLIISYFILNHKKINDLLYYRLRQA